MKLGVWASILIPLQIRRLPLTACRARECRNTNTSVALERVNRPFASACVALLPSCPAGAVSAVSLGSASHCALEAPEPSSGPGRKAPRSSPPQPSSL